MVAHGNAQDEQKVKETEMAQQEQALDQSGAGAEPEDTQGDEQGEVSGETISNRAGATALCEQLGALIKRARREVRGMTREAFASEIGCSPVTLDHLEAGTPGVGSRHLAAALFAIGAADGVASAVRTRVEMMLVAARPISFPGPAGGAAPRTSPGTGSKLP